MQNSLLQFGVRRGEVANFFGIFEGEGAHWADFDAFATLGASGLGEGFILVS